MKFVCSETVSSGASGSEVVCLRTVGSETVWLELVEGAICGSICVLGGCCCGDEVFYGSGAYCWGLSEMTSLEVTASEAISEAFSEFGLTLSGSSPE
jgi:hypothetical protein